MESRTGKTLVPGVVNTGTTVRTSASGTVAPGQGPQAPGLDKMLEVVVSAPDPAQPQAFLLVISGSDPGRLHVLDRPELVIGRSKYADIRISERAMSQQHAKLLRVGDRHRLYDLGSTNGTYVNDQRIDQVDLEIGDVVRTGETVFTYMSASSGDPSVSESTLALPAGSPNVTARQATGSHGVLARQGGPMPPVRAPPHPQVVHAPSLDAEESPDLLTLIMRVLAFFGRYWLSMLILTVLGTAAGVASYRVFKPAATATFQLNLIPAPSDNPVERGRRVNFEFFRAAQQNFVRPGLIKQTLTALGEEEVTPARIRGVQRRLSLSRGRGNRFVYAGEFSAATPDQARDFLNEHLKLYLQTELDKALKVLLVEVATLEQQLADNDKELDATEQAILAFKQENSAGFTEASQQLAQELISLGSERGRASSEVARAAAELKLARRRLQSESPLIESRIEMARPYENAISDVRRDLAAAKASGKGSAHPDVVKLKANLRLLTRQRDDVMKHGTTKIVKAKNPIYDAARRAVDDAQAAYKIAQAELGRLSGDEKKAKAIVEELPRLQAEYSELTRSYDATKKVHDNLFDKLTVSSIQLEMERAQVAARYDIISSPDVEPVSAVKTMAIRGIMAGALGFIFGIFLGLLRDLRRLIAARLAHQRRR